MDLKKKIWAVSMKNGDVFWVLDCSENISKFTEVLFGDYIDNKLNLKEFEMNTGRKVVINVGCISSYNEIEVME